MGIRDTITNLLKREEQSKDAILLRDKSREQIKGFAWSSPEQTVFPDFSLEACEAMIQDDPVARGALKHLIDKFMEGDFYIIDEKTNTVDYELLDKLNNKYLFRENIIRECSRKGELYNNVFIEIVRGIGLSAGSLKIAGINVLDSSNVSPITYPNGDLKVLKSKNTHEVKNDYITWKSKDITWLKFGDKAKGFAPIDMKSLWETLLAKSYVKQFVSWLWMTGQYRILYAFESGADKDINDFKVVMKRAEKDFRIPGLVRGKLEAKVLRDIKEQESIQKLLEYYDNQILIEMRVSPVDAGKPDESGRSSADAQNNAVDSHITSMKKCIADYISYDLFPKMGLEGKRLIFEPNNRFSVKQLLENIQAMQSCGFTNEACEEYLNKKGIYFKSKTFMEKEVAPEVNNPRDKDNMPSRIGKGTGESNQNQDEITTREDQLHKTR